MEERVRSCPHCSRSVPVRHVRCGYCGGALEQSGSAAEIRRQATIVTSDLKGSTALGERLDPESLREVMTTYIDEMRAVFEAHGGTIEKIIGDAIVAVFGLPIAQDDDALRAVEAAAETQRALISLNDRLDARWGVRLTVRTGVATGDVVVGEASVGQHVLTGPTIAVATVMEQNSPPQEVLLAASTYEVVREAIDAEPMGPVTPKGGGPTIDTYRLVSVAERPVPAVAASEGSGRLCQTCGEENPDDFRYCGTCGDTLAARVRVQDTRKTVTIVFADPKPSSADGGTIGPEALRDVMSRYFAAMQRALERHGATVEKFIGDAVMAVFGLPTRHEDDALRAVRAAFDMQQALPDLNAAFSADWGVTLANHIGVNTGEVVAGDASLGQRLVTGDTVNVAARLEQAAGPREILLGDLTYRLVRGATTVDEVEPLTLKGKSEPVPAYRLLSVAAAGEGIERRSDAPMVGRDDEMRRLAETFAQAVTERGARMATVVGDAGVGKSRLIAEFTGGREADALVIRGRCLPYGEGITFWPLREAARDAAGISDDEPQSAAIAKLRARVDDDAVTDRIASVIGLSSSPFPVPEIFWGARKFLEGLARERPVLVVWDDIHWAEATFLELIGHLVETIEDAPVLLLCSSRHDLLEGHPDWAQGERDLRLVLAPLTDADAGLVVQALLGGTGIAPEVQDRIVRASAGNPLFVEQLLSMLIDDGSLRQDGGHWEQVRDLTHLAVPPSIQALLAARLDLLDGAERNVIEPASVIGQNFAQAAVTVLAPEEIRAAIPQHLKALDRKQLVQPNPGADDDEAFYRFQHLLVRDAAYGGLLKRARAELHERFVDWAEEINARQGRTQEFEEIQGYHLEQAYRYLTELGTLDDHAIEVGARASQKLASAGRRAMARGDAPAAASLYRRATETLSPDAHDRGTLLPRLAEAYLEIGEFPEAQAALDEASRIATAADDELLGAEAAVVRLFVALFTADQADWADAAAVEAERVIPLFEAAQDHARLGLAYRLLFILHGTPGRYAEAAAAAEQIIAHSRAAEDRRLETRGITGYAQAALFGPTPVSEALERCRSLIDEVSGDRRAEALIRLTMAQLSAMQGAFDEARSLSATAKSMLADLGKGVVASSTSIDTAQVELLAGDLAAAESALRADDAALAEFGEQYVRSTVTGLLARTLLLSEKIEEARVMASTTREIGAPDDVDPQIAWRVVEGTLLAREGHHADALRLIEEAKELSLTADNPRLQASVLTDLAEAQRAAGNEADAETALAEAAALYEAKGDTVSRERIRQMQ